MGDLDQAGDCFESALVPATAGQHPPIPIFLAVVLNLANLRLRQERWVEAEGHYDAAQDLSTAARNGTIKVQCLERRGEAQHRQGKTEEAVQSWSLAAAIAEKLEETELHRSNLLRLQEHFLETDQRTPLNEVQKKLQELSRGSQATGDAPGAGA